MTQSDSGRPPGADRGEHHAVDWVAAEESPEFRELVKKRRRFVLPATIFFLAKAARSSVVWAMGLIGAFYVMTTFFGFGARAILGQAGEEPAGEGGNLAAPLLAEQLGGGPGSVGGSVLLAVIVGVAFATILAVVAGLVISASGAAAHDIWSNIIRKGRDSEREEVIVARIAALIIGAIAIAIATSAARA